MKEKSNTHASVTDWKYIDCGENLSSIREKKIVSMNSLVSNELASAPFYVRGQILNNLDEDRNHEFKVSKARSTKDWRICIGDSFISF